MLHWVPMHQIGKDKNFVSVKISSKCLCPTHPVLTKRKGGGSSVQFSSLVMSSSLQPHGWSTPGLPVHHQLPQLAHTHVHWVDEANIWFCVIPFSSSLQSFPASRSFPMSQFFASGGQSIGASASASVLPVNIQDWSPLGWTGWISLQSKGLSTVFSNTVAEKHHSLVLSFLYGPTLTSIHDYWKTI